LPTTKPRLHRTFVRHDRCSLSSITTRQRHLHRGGPGHGRRPHVKTMDGKTFAGWAPIQRFRQRRYPTSSPPTLRNEPTNFSAKTRQYFPRGHQLTGLGAATLPSSQGGARVCSTRQPTLEGSFRRRKASHGFNHRAYLAQPGLSRDTVTAAQRSAICFLFFFFFFSFFFFFFFFFFFIFLEEVLQARPFKATGGSRRRLRRYRQRRRHDIVSATSAKKLRCAKPMAGNRKNGSPFKPLAPKSNGWHWHSGQSHRGLRTQPIVTVNTAVGALSARTSAC